ncbi:MAG: hypothetical protein COT14_00820 [Candidatus Diapherotrites archaeon CG08_land_8_20_14_0_20_30_16]|nr:MAG: hypothetical protein COT14_00820 [Candidatus Diapherotrites archaeon CG08_land_8_20_14_0_20_30_16]
MWEFKENQNNYNYDYDEHYEELYTGLTFLHNIFLHNTYTNISLKCFSNYLFFVSIRGFDCVCNNLLFDYKGKFKYNGMPEKRKNQ